ncbi:MAG: hypothetical protein ACRDTR_00110 [Rubrobacter sp.]
MSVLAVKSRRWAVLGVVFAGMLVASILLGEQHSPCYDLYLGSGLSQETVSFESFRELYDETLCAPNGANRVSS